MNKFWAVFSAIWLVAVLLQSRFCRKKSSLLRRVPFRLLRPRQETAHPVDGLPLFIVQHMSISLGGDNGGVAHEIRTLFLTSFFLRRKRPQKYKKDFRHPKGGTGGLPSFTLLFYLKMGIKILWSPCQERWSAR